MFPVRDDCNTLWLEVLGRVNESRSYLEGDKCYVLKSDYMLVIKKMNESRMTSWAHGLSTWADIALIYLGNPEGGSLFPVHILIDA